MLRFKFPSKGLVSLVLISVIIMGAVFPFMQTAVAQIGVDNDGPSFTDISIVETGDLIHVNVGIRDLNGWDNIFAVVVTVYGKQNNIISQVNYSQYASYSSDTLIPQWTQVQGDYLNRDESRLEAVMVWPWNPQNTQNPIGLNLTFGYNKFAGNNITIVCTDKGSVPLSCEYSGPFSAEFTPPPAFGDNVAIPISLSGIVAALGGLFMSYRRHKNNQLARAVEASERGK